MSKRKKHTPESWQCLPKGSRRFSMVYDSMIDSQACRDLSSDAFRLLIVCIRESHGAAQRDNAVEGGEGDPRLFYMNRSLRCKVHKLYPLSDSRRIEKNMAELVGHGFVDCFKSGQDEKTKSVYRLSARWHHWNTPAFRMPDSLKTRHMLHVEAKELRAKNNAKKDSSEGSESS